MAKSITVRLPDGSSHTYDNVPDSVTQEQAEARAAQEFGAKSSAATIKPEKQLAETTPAQRPAAQPPTASGVLRGAGIGLRDLVSGATALPALAADVATAPLTGMRNLATAGYNKLTGGNVPAAPMIGGTSQAVQSMMDAFGLPQAQTDTERMISAATRGVAGAATGLGAGGAIGATAAPASNAARLAQVLSAAPRTQLAAGATSPMAGEAVRQSGGGPGAQLAAELATAIGVTNPAAALRPAGRAASEVLGFTTGVGSKPIQEAASAGMAGGAKAAAFRQNISGEASTLDVVDEAKKALAQIRADRAAAYNSGMVNIKNDATVLDMKPILAKVADVKNRGIFKGKVKNESASKTWDEIDAAVNDWNGSNPADFHTPEGLDALKQRIGDIRDSQQIGTPSYNVAKEVYAVIKDQIAAQAPTYSKVMRDYTDASELITQMETALSLGNKAQADTALRKLQSVLRNNAQTNYGRRAELGDVLATQGAGTLYPALAGQAMGTWTPRAISGAGSALTTGALGAMSPKMLAMLPLTSPRLVGEAAYGLGAAARVPNQLANALMRGGKPPIPGVSRDALAAALAAMAAGNAAQQ